MPRFTTNRAWLVSYLQRLARERRKAALEAEPEE